MMRVSDDGLADLAVREGIVLAPYLSGLPGDPWTWGIGHTAAAGAPDPATMPRAMPADPDAAIAAAIAQLHRDLVIYEARVNQRVTVPMTQPQFDALVSFDVNTGGVWYRTRAGVWRSATAIQRLNSGDTAGCAAALMFWCNPPEVTKRRQQEQALFLRGTYLTDPIGVYRTDSAGRREKNPYRALSRTDFLRFARG